MRKIFLLISLSIFAPMNLFAAPGITGVSGTLSDGQAISISGSSFGSHPLKIEWIGGPAGLIETSTADQIPTKDKWYFDSNIGADTLIATDQVHSGSKSLKSDANSSEPNGDIRYDWGSAIDVHQYIFISWWVRRIHTGSGQWKMFRLGTINNITDNETESTLFNWDTQQIWGILAGRNESDTVASWNPPFPSADNRWYRMDYIIYTSAINTADGIYTLNLYDPDGGSFQTKTLSNIKSTRTADLLYRYLIWQNYHGNGITDQTVWTDDIYIQVGTQARVEIGENSTWGNCKHMEIQYPTAWANEAITFTLNKGSFAEGGTVYLYIVDENGNVSDQDPATTGAQGYPITISSSKDIGTLVPPGAPSLIIQ